ncbi:MAG: hypothetical protein ACT4O2_15630 [Beijerinckiaceae bacterium]
MVLAQAAISPKSSQEQIVARGGKSRTSAREYMTRYDERSSASLEKALATRQEDRADCARRQA